VTLDTNSKVEEIKRVIDTAGNKVAPATEGLQQAIRDRLGNQSGLSGFTYTTSSTTAEQLDAGSVPEGVTVLLQAPTSNGSKMFVGFSTEQPIEMQPGGTVALDVTDTSHIYVRASTSGDDVGVLYEDG